MVPYKHLLNINYITGYLHANLSLQSSKRFHFLKDTMISKHMISEE